MDDDDISCEIACENLQELGMKPEWVLFRSGCRTESKRREQVFCNHHRPDDAQHGRHPGPPGHQDQGRRGQDRYVFRHGPGVHGYGRGALRRQGLYCQALLSLTGCSKTVTSILGAPDG